MDENYIRLYEIYKILYFKLKSSIYSIYSFYNYLLVDWSVKSIKMYRFSWMNIFNYNNCIITRICLQNIWSICIEEKQIGTNYQVVVLLATYNNKVTNKISVNFKFYKMWYKRNKKQKFFLNKEKRYFFKFILFGLRLMYNF